MFSLYEKVSVQCSKNITQTYSTSFSLGIKTLSKNLRQPIYGIYGMVRLADEIVDTFHNFDKKTLLEKFKRDTFEAIELGISLNPVLQSFQQTVNQYQIPIHLIEAFFKSMEMDLYKTTYSEQAYSEYIYGSAEVVGLMCLKVFADGDEATYQKLQPSARALGAAFQKVNFLRDMGSDLDERGRVYFPGIDFENFKEQTKKQIEDEVAEDFKNAYKGIKQLPAGAQYGVMLAYRYYLRLFRQIRNSSVSKIKETRIRVSGIEKVFIFVRTLASRPLNGLRANTTLFL